MCCGGLQHVFLQPFMCVSHWPLLPQMQIEFYSFEFLFLYSSWFPSPRAKVKMSWNPSSISFLTNFPPINLYSTIGAFLFIQYLTVPVMTKAKSPFSFIIRSSHLTPRQLSRSLFERNLQASLFLSKCLLPATAIPSWKTSSSRESSILTSGSSLRPEYNFRLISRYKRS